MGSHQETQPQENAFWQFLTSREKVHVQISCLEFGMCFPMGTIPPSEPGARGWGFEVNQVLEWFAMELKFGLEFCFIITD